MQTPGQNTILPLPVPEKASENGKGLQRREMLPGCQSGLNEKSMQRGKADPLHTLILIWDISAVHKTL